MKTTHGLAKHGRRRKRPTIRSGIEPQQEPTGQRLHGDSYAEVGAREDELAGTSSSHVAPSDRRLEEPSDPGRGTPERGEDST